MKTTLENNILTLFLEGRIDSGAAALCMEEIAADYPEHRKASEQTT